MVCGAVVIIWTFIYVPCVTSALSPWENSDTVTTLFGNIKGFPDLNNTWVWKAIPFAAPPDRWRAPTDPPSWSGMREITEFCEACTQPQSFGQPGAIVGSEDCLYLNIWRPQSEATLLPVYVWIHGGGNSLGSAAFYVGSTIAGKSNMVVVSVQYRLGPLGWFTHPSLRDNENVFDGSGNYGTLDIIQALKWVKNNIQAFGGDPSNVTIAGESAGGMNVLSLMISPEAGGLFHKAVSQSGLLRPFPLSVGDYYANRVLELLLVSDGTPEDRAQSVREGMSNDAIEVYIRSKSAQEIFSAASTAQGSMMSVIQDGGFGMIVFPNIFKDGAIVHQDGARALSNPSHYNRVPIILGTNKEELKLFMAPLYSAFQTELLYQKSTGLLSETMWKPSGVDMPAARMTASGSPGVYAYQLNYGKYSYRANRDGSTTPVGYNPWPTDYGDQHLNLALILGCHHGLDIPFFFGDFHIFDQLYELYEFPSLFREDNRSGYEALSDAMMAYVAQFAHTGSPSGVLGLPQWTQWSNRLCAPKRILFDANDTEAIIKMSIR